jgi:hypothetical protein
VQADGRVPLVNDGVEHHVDVHCPRQFQAITAS